ncbi:hypothetical protein TNCV_802451 [Trichonephila clavipes]|nr:hypothetical protein TNCV_802451 [Trichonephila clavipes]
MSSRHHIDDFMRGRIIGKIEEGRKITDVAREFDITHSVVSKRLWKSFKTTGMNVWRLIEALGSYVKVDPKPQSKSRPWASTPMIH